MAAVGKAQDLGIAENDPRFDVDGRNATVKVSALAMVLMDNPLKPKDVQREGIRRLSMEQVPAVNQKATAASSSCGLTLNVVSDVLSLKLKRQKLRDFIGGLFATRGINEKPQIG